jgi:hypothetical protein
MVIIDAYLSCRLVNIRIWYSVVHYSANLQYRRSRITYRYIPESISVNWGNAFQPADKKALISQEREGEWCYFCDIIHVTLRQGAVLCAKKNQKHVPRILTYILLLSAVTNSWRMMFIYPDHVSIRILRNVGTRLPDSTALRDKTAICVVNWSVWSD